MRFANNYSVYIAADKLRILTGYILIIDIHFEFFRACALILSRSPPFAKHVREKKAFFFFLEVPLTLSLMVHKISVLSVIFCKQSSTPFLLNNLKEKVLKGFFLKHPYMYKQHRLQRKNWNSMESVTTHK